MGLFGNSYDELCKKGIKALEARNLERASQLLMKAISKDPSRPRAFHWLGMTYQDAASEFSLRGDKARQSEYGTKAVNAFDEAIARETDQRLRAEFWWQRGIVFGGLGSSQEQNLSWAKADEIVSGFTTRRRKDLEDAFVSHARKMIASGEEAKR